MAGRLWIQNGAAEPRPACQLDSVWMFPPTYALHLAEEYFAADGFPLWVQRALGLAFTTAEFVAWNAFALILTCVAAWLVSRDAKFRFVEIALAVAVLGNVAEHVLVSIVTWTYSPGLITGCWSGALCIEAATQCVPGLNAQGATCRNIHRRRDGAHHVWWRRVRRDTQPLNRAALRFCPVEPVGTGT